MKKLALGILLTFLAGTSVAQEIGGYPTASALNGNERILADQSNATVNILPSQIATYLGTLDLTLPSISGQTGCLYTNGTTIVWSPTQCSGGGGGSGTVTSVGLSVPSGFVVTGSPITSSGTLAITTSLSGVILGTGTGLSTAAASNIISLWSGTCNSTTYLRADGTCQPASGGSGGTVTSVALTAPAWLTVTGSPVTNTGTLALTGTSETANQVLASPNGSAGAPSFRALVSADIPTALSGLTSASSLSTIGTIGTGVWQGTVISPLYGGSGEAGTVTGLLAGNGTSPFSAATSTNVLSLWSGTCNATTYLRGDGSCQSPPGSGTVTSVGLSAPSVFSVTGTPVTGSGTLALTFATGQTANEFLATPNGITGAVGLRAIVAADIPTLNQNTTGTAANITATSNATLTTLSALSLPETQVTGLGTFATQNYATPPAIGGTTPAAANFTTIGATGQITSTLATGTAPFSVASTTPVTNLSIGGNAATATNLASYPAICTAGLFSTGLSSGSNNCAAVGSTTQVIYNQAGALTGNSNFTWNQSSNVLNLGASTTPGTLSIGSLDSMTVNGSPIPIPGFALNSNIQGVIENHSYVNGTAAGAARIYLARSEGTISAPTIVANGDSLGTIYGIGYGGVTGNYLTGGYMRFSVDGTPSSTAMPTDWTLALAPAGSTTAATVIKAYQDAGVTIGAATGGDKGAGTLNATGLYVNGVAVGNVSNTGTPTAGQFAEWTSATAIGGQTLGGDCTLSTATITCTKTSGTAFSALATTAPGTGVATALGVNVGTAGSFVVNGGALGTPSSGVATNLTGTASGLTAGTATVANGLNSATTTVAVSSATAPTAGQVLTATSGTAATWQTPTTGSGTVSSGTSGQIAYYGATGTTVSGLNVGNCLTISSGTLSQLYAVNAQTGTTYTIAATDACKLITFSNASPIAVTLPQAGTTGFAAGSMFDVQNIGAGTATITPTTSTINGSATLTVAQNTGCTIVSDGTNYQVGVCTALGGSGTGTVNSGTAGQLTYYASTGTAVSGNANATVSAGALTLGASGTAGSVTMGNATSGLLTLAPTTGALGTVTASFPANSGTVAELNIGQTFTATQVFPYAQLNGTAVASSSFLSFQTAPFTGGTGSTTRPELYFNTGVTAPTTFSTAGTFLGGNAPSAFTGNLEAWYINGGAAVYTLNYQGNITAGTYNGTTIPASATLPTLTGAITSGHCAQWSTTGGNLVDSGAACGTGGSSAFSALTSSTNTTAAMVVGTGASLTTSGTGTIAATSLGALTGMPSQAATTLLANTTGGSAAPTAVAYNANQFSTLVATVTMTYTATGCTPSASSLSPTGGTITLAAGPCTQLVLTPNGATGVTAAHGWICTAGDQTAMNAGTYIPEWYQKSSTTTTCTVPIPAAVGATDVIWVKAVPY